jgi:hypothetical protein
MEHGLNTDFTNTGGNPCFICVSSVAKSSCLYGGNPPGQPGSVPELAIFPTFLLRTPKFSGFCVTLPRFVSRALIHADLNQLRSVKRWPTRPSGHNSIVSNSE